VKAWVRRPTEAHPGRLVGEDPTSAQGQNFASPRRVDYVRFTPKCGTLCRHVANGKLVPPSDSCTATSGLCRFPILRPGPLQRGQLSCQGLEAIPPACSLAVKLTPWSDQSFCADEEDQKHPADDQVTAQRSITLLGVHRCTRKGLSRASLSKHHEPLA
jgi:hypothetical protein